MSQLDPTNTTAGDICSAALQMARVIGIGQTATADQTTRALAHLQWMLQEWERKRWKVYHLVTYGIVCNGGGEYTVGPGGQIDTSQTTSWALDPVSLPQVVSPGTGYAVNDTVTLTGGAQLTVSSVSGTGGVTGFSFSSFGSFTNPLPTSLVMTGTSGAGVNLVMGSPTWDLLGTSPTNNSVRPARIESCFLRQLQNTAPNQIDYPLQIMQSREDYNRIALKSLVSFAKVAWYDSGWPLGTLYLYPVPNASIYGIYISILEQLPIAFATGASLINLPYEYYYALVTNLALRIYPAFGKRVMQGDTLPQQAKDALDTISSTNVQISALTMPAQLVRPGLYNVFSDQNY